MKLGPKQPPKRAKGGEDLPRATWDFEDRTFLPDDECEAARIWEYLLGLGSNPVLETVVHDQALHRQWRSLIESPKFQLWRESNPPPVLCEDWAAWNRKMSTWNDTVQQKFPSFGDIKKARTNYHVNWVWNWPEFPGKHWQEIPSAVRRGNDRLYPKGFSWDQSPAERGESTPLATVPGNFAITESGILWAEIPSGPGFAAATKWMDGFSPVCEATTRTPFGCAFKTSSAELRMFEINWNRSDKKLIEDFASWLKKNRPLDILPFQSTKDASSRKTSPREKLKALGAARVYAHLGESRPKALEFAKRHQTAGEAKHPLPQDQSHWRTTLENAKQFLREFEREVFG